MQIPASSRRGRGEGHDSRVGSFPCPKHGYPSGPIRKRGGRLSSKGSEGGLSRSVLPTSLQVFLKEAAGNHPRSSGVSHACTGGPNTGAKAHSGAGVPGSPAVPIPSGSSSPALSMCSPLFLQAQEVKARLMAKRPGLGLEGSFVFYLGQLG